MSTFHYASAQIDAFNRGQNALNIGNIKTKWLYQPKEIIIDSILLSTLPQIQFNSGMAEAIKYALLFDESLFDQIENKSFTLPEMIFRCAELKAQITSRDEFDLSERKALNFGHTVGHALESLSQFYLSHGEAVACENDLEINRTFVKT